jgi:hypothetical protein
MPTAVALRRVGFPTALTMLFVGLLWVSPVRAALSPPSIRLAQVFEREIWGHAPASLPVPVRPGGGPIPYEVP